MAQLASLKQMDPIVEAVAGVDTGRLRTVAEQWDAVVNAIFKYHHEFDSRTSQVAKHWRGKASAALQESANTAGTRMSDWTREAPDRATSMRVVAYFVDDMLRYLRQKQAQRTEDLNTIITAYNNAVKQSQEYFLVGPDSPFAAGLQTAFKVEMVDEVGNRRKTLEDDFWDWIFGEAYDMEARLEAYKNEVMTFYDQLAVAVATKYGALINNEKEWTSPGRYLGLHSKGSTFDKGPGDKPELDRPGGPGDSASTGTPQTTQTTRPRTPDLDGRTKPTVEPPKQDPKTQQQQQPREQQPQQQQPQAQQEQQPQGQQPQPDGPQQQPPVRPPLNTQPLVPTPVPPIAGLPVLPIVEPRAGSALTGGASGGRGAGATAAQSSVAGLAGRLGEAGPAVLSGRTAGGSPAQQPFFPPIPPGAPGAAGGAGGGRAARPRRPITIGGARVVDDGRSGAAGTAVSGRQVGRKKAEPPRQREDQLTGYETPAVAEQEEPQQHERRVGGAA